MFDGLWTSALFFIGIALILLAVFDPLWFWQSLRSIFPVFDRIDRQLRHFNLRVLLGVVGVWLIYGQLRMAADSFFGSLIGQIVFVGGSALLLWLAFRQRNK